MSMLHDLLTHMADRAPPSIKAKCMSVLETYISHEMVALVWKLVVTTVAQRHHNDPVYTDSVPPATYHQFRKCYHRKNLVQKIFENTNIIGTKYGAEIF